MLESDMAPLPRRMPASPRVPPILAGLLTLVLGLGGAQAANPAPAAALQDGDYSWIYSVLHPTSGPYAGTRGAHATTIRTPEGLYGVLDAQTYRLAVRGTPEPVRVSAVALHTTSTCDTDLCEIVGHQALEMKRGQDWPGWEYAYGRVTLRLERTADPRTRAARHRYPRYHHTDYLVRLHFADGSVVKVVLYGLPE